MKNLFLFFCACLIIYSCELKNETTPSGDIKEPLIDQVYSFKKLSNPEIWKTFNNLEEMQKAAQIPEHLLKVMSTENLAKTCLNYPLFFIYTAYNNEIDGIKVIMNSFNGFIELKKRTDAAHELIKLYSSLEVPTNGRYSIATKADLSAKKTLLHLGYLELVLSSEEISNNISNQDLNELHNMVLDKYQIKIDNPQTYSMFSIKKSLLLGAKVVLLEDNSNSQDHLLLKEFISNGGNIQSKKYERLSKIITTK